MSPIKSLFLFTALTISVVVFADDESDTKEGPCKRIIDACKKSPVVETDKEKRGLFKNCVRPIMKGETVAGVNVDKADLDACRAKKRSMPSFK